MVSESFPTHEKCVEVPFVLDETFRLANRGLEVHIAAYSYGRQSFSKGMYIYPLRRRVNLSAIKMGIMKFREFASSLNCHPVQTYIFWNYAENVTRLAKKTNPDIIHAHFAYVEGFAAILGTKTIKKPIIVTCHGSDVLTEPSVNYGLRLKKRYARLVAKTLRKADMVIAVSQAVYSAALEAGASPDKMRLIHNGVDLARFNPHIEGSHIRQKLGLGCKPMVFTLRTHVPKNGIEYLIKSAPLVLKKNPDVTFVIGSDGPLRNEYERLVRNLGIVRNVIFTGRMPQNELPYYYAACDAFVIPSLIEGFGLAAIEAAACGKPVIGTNVGGIPEIIEDGVSGYLVEPKNPSEIAEKIIFLIENPNLMKKMGLEGRRITEQRFNVDKRIDKLMSLYHELIEVRK